MNIISSVTIYDEYKTLEAKTLKALKMPLFFFLIYIRRRTIRKKLLENIVLNKNKVQNIWIDEYKKWLKELRDLVSQKCMIKREIRMKIKELKPEKEDKIDILQWKLRTEKILIKDNDVDGYFQRMKLNEIKGESKKEIYKINESIIIEEWSIGNDDMIVKLKDCIKDVEEELKIKEIILKKLKVSDERIDEITSQYFGCLE